MSFTDKETKLDERIAWIEGLEGTVKYCYKAEPDDAKKYLAAARKKVVVLFAIAAAMFFVLLVWSIMTDDKFFIGLAGIMTVLSLAIVFFFVIGMQKSKGYGEQLDEIELAFNAYGVVIRMCNDIGCSVCAYAWNDFDSIVEYPTAIVGVKRGLSYVFPKRVFTEEGYNKFRNFSYAAVGKKCVYKNFKR